MPRAARRSSATCSTRRSSRRTQRSYSTCRRPRRPRRQGWRTSTTRSRARRRSARLRWPTGVGTALRSPRAASSRVAAPSRPRPEPCPNGTRSAATTPAGAARVSADHARLTKRLDRYERLSRDYEDARELFAMDGEMADEIAASIAPLRNELERLQEDALFTGEYDGGDAVVTIHAGTGGTDAQDWAEILLRMYLRWASDRGFQAELIEASPGEEAGLKSATFTVKGENAYGILKAERGVHRLVRLSPFDQAHRRQPSLAPVNVILLQFEAESVTHGSDLLRCDSCQSSVA